MSVKLTCLNVRSLRDQCKVAHLLCDLLSFYVGVATIKEMHFVCNFDSWVLLSNFVVYSAYGVWQARSVSLLVQVNVEGPVDHG